MSFKATKKLYLPRKKRSTSSDGQLWTRQMQQLSFFDSGFPLAGVLPAVKASMRRLAGDEGECRKTLVDKINTVAAHSQIPLTGGNCKTLSLDTLNKILSPSDTSHPPSILFVLAFCRAVNNYEPVSIIARAAGFELMSTEDIKFRDYGKSIKEEKQARKTRLERERNL